MLACKQINTIVHNVNDDYNVSNDNYLYNSHFYPLQNLSNDKELQLKKNTLNEKTIKQLNVLGFYYYKYVHKNNNNNNDKYDDNFHITYLYGQLLNFFSEENH